ncbi:MAG: hypothetical protein CMH53_09530 [Myxococcales bacterium]|nr:hypothetical protein [Myxococcales bacterium]
MECAPMNQSATGRKRGKNDLLGWAVLGSGRAGTIRARDIQASPEHRLVSHVGGRQGEGALQRAVRDPDVDAVAVCLANAEHAKWSRFAVEAGKDVLVEFPLCASERQARELFSLASARGRLEHDEIIGLLTASHSVRQAQMASGQASRIEVSFQGGLYRWVAQEAMEGRVGQLAMGRLQALDQLCGRLRVEQVSCRSEQGGYVLTASLQSADGVSIELKESRWPGLKRASQWRIVDDRGEELGSAPTTVAAGGLFERDLQVFRRRRDGDHAAAYVSTLDVISVQRIADIISAQAHWRPQVSAVS